MSCGRGGVHNMIDIGIIIVNYKMRDRILTALPTIRKDAQKSGLSVRVVVVDNASSDNLGKILKNQYPEVAYIENRENLGFGKANNLGMAAVEAKYYFILNPDTRFTENATLRRLYDWMEREQAVGMVGPRLAYTDGRLQESCFRYPRLWDKPLRQLGFERFYWAKRRIDTFLMRDFDHRTTRPVDWILGSAMFVRKSAVDAVGGFDDRFFMYFEDCDWCRRFWDAHFPVYYLPEVTIEHVYQRGSAKTKGTLRSLLFNKLTRIHLQSWVRYFQKWGLDL